MIESKELRIGNYYTDEDGEQHTFDWSDMSWMDWDYCKPIPLTEEWLVKFGFVDGCLYGIGSENKDEIFVSLKGDNTMYISDSRDSYYSFPAPCKHVHTLQNLYFALTGSELKIK